MGLLIALLLSIGLCIGFFIWDNDDGEWKAIVGFVSLLTSIVLVCLILLMAVDSYTINKNAQMEYETTRDRIENVLAQDNPTESDRSIALFYANEWNMKVKKAIIWKDDFWVGAFISNELVKQPLFDVSKIKGAYPKMKLIIDKEG